MISNTLTYYIPDMFVKFNGAFDNSSINVSTRCKLNKTREQHQRQHHSQCIVDWE